jgi:hypothetical protein
VAEPQIEAAYLAARYRIDIGGRWIERRIGVVDAGADSLLAAAGCRTCWSIVTPCNPGSIALPAAVNAQRLADLQAAVRAAGWRHLPSENSDVGGRWPEAGLCLLDVGTDRVHVLAARFGQLAFVHGRLGDAPALAWVAAR